MNIPQTIQIFKALIRGPVSRMDLADQVGVCPKTIGKILVSLKAEKLIHVIDYTNRGDGRNRVKIYALGDGEDVLPTFAQTEEQRKRRSYLKKMRRIRQKKIPKPITTFVGGKSLWQ